MPSMLQIQDLKNFVAALSVCPHPKKRKYKTPAKARKYARLYHMDWYECVCGKYHLTSKVHHDNCPLCGLPDDEYQSCGCFEEIHYGRD